MPRLRLLLYVCTFSLSRIKSKVSAFDQLTAFR